LRQKHTVTQFPETRKSLIIQVKDPENRVAWEQFVAIYRPVIVRTAAARGLQEADAQHLKGFLEANPGSIGLPPQP